MIESLYEGNKLLEKSLNASWARNDTIAQNIANVDTSNYKRKDVVFEDYLKDSMGRTDLEGKNIDEIQPTVVQDNSNTSMRIDGNNVDIDSEMASLAKNTIRYNALVQLINGNYSKIKNVIREGK